MTSRFVDEFPAQFRSSSLVPPTPKLKSLNPKPSTVNPSPAGFSSTRAYWESVARQSAAASSPSPKTRVGNIKDRITDLNARLSPTPEPSLKLQVGNIRNKITHLKYRLSTSEADNEKLAHQLDKLRSIAYEPTESRIAAVTVSCGSQSDNQLRFEVTRLQTLVEQLKKDYHDSKVAADNNAEELDRFKTSYHTEEAKNKRLEKAVDSAKQDCQNLLVVKELQLVQANRFISALTSINLREPVLQRAHTALKNGKEADAALVASIKEAAKKSDTPWATIIPAVVGERPSDLYLNAIQRCAKLEALLQESEKKRRFWKMKAKAHALHRQTITPSSSSLSLVLGSVESNGMAEDDTGETSESQPATATLCSHCSASKTPSHDEGTELSIPSSSGNLFSPVTDQDSTTMLIVHSSQEHASVDSEGTGDRSASTIDGRWSSVAAERPSSLAIQAGKDSQMNSVIQTNHNDEKVLTPMYGCGGKRNEASTHSTGNEQTPEIVTGNKAQGLSSTSTSTNGLKKPLGNSSILNVPPVLKQTVIGGIKRVQKMAHNSKKTDKVHQMVSLPVSSTPQLRSPSLKSPTTRKTSITTQAKHNISAVHHSPKREPPSPPTGIRRVTVSSERKSVYFDESANGPERINKHERKTAFESSPTPMPPSTGRFSSPIISTPTNTRHKVFDHGRKAVKSIAKLIT